MKRRVEVTRCRLKFLNIFVDYNVSRHKDKRIFLINKKKGGKQRPPLKRNNLTSRQIFYNLKSIQK